MKKKKKKEKKEYLQLYFKYVFIFTYWKLTTQLAEKLTPVIAVHRSV